MFRWKKSGCSTAVDHKITRSEFETAAAAGGSSVRLNLTKLLDEALSDPNSDAGRTGVTAAAALGLLRLHGTPGLIVLDQGEGYRYTPILSTAGVEDALAELRTLGVRVPHPATRSRVH